LFRDGQYVEGSWGAGVLGPGFQRIRKGLRHESRESHGERKVNGISDRR
jgi:hypothetical protein